MQSPPAALPLDVTRLALRQHGIILVEQLVLLGVPRRTIRTQVSTRRWREVYPGVLVSATQPMTDLAKCTAATLMLRPDGALAQHSALALRGLTSFPSQTHVVTQHARRYRLPRDFVVHRTRDFPESDVCVLRGMRTTTVERALIDAAPTCTHTHLTLLIDESIRRGAATADRLLERALELKKFGRRGPKEVIEIAATRPASAPDARSPFEILAARALEEWALPRPEFNARVVTPQRTYECDVVWRQERVILECDSRIHDLEDQRQFDQLKDENLRTAGFRVIRVRLTHFTRRPRELRKRLTGALGLGT
ncbi:MAG: DUF559 domain-containing protein [Acidimicrobiia bacterium]|nr:DUF559 domain-containing protein [Acidimicrobiia bacterium]